MFVVVVDSKSCGYSLEKIFMKFCTLEVGGSSYNGSSSPFCCFLLGRFLLVLYETNFQTENIVVFVVVLFSVFFFIDFLLQNPVFLLDKANRVLREIHHIFIFVCMSLYCVVLYPLDKWFV